MYFVYWGDQVLYAPSIANNGFFIQSPKLSSALNSSGTFSFVIDQNNPYYDKVLPYGAQIHVYNDWRQLFRGRVISVEKDFWRRKAVTCEGQTAYLRDSILRPYTYDGPVDQYFAYLIAQHNAQVSAERRFTVGRCTVTDPNNRIIRANQNYPTVHDEIHDKLIDLLGGYLISRRDGSTQYLDYLSDLPTGNQIVEFRQNLLDLTDLMQFDDFYTRIIPLGKKDDETGLPLTIASVNGGVDYLDNAATIPAYGIITRAVNWDDVTLPENLKSKGQAALNAVAGIQTLMISAADLGLLNVNVDQLEVGKKYRILSPPHGVDTILPLAEAHLDLFAPDRSQYVFGAKIKTLTGG